MKGETEGRSSPIAPKGSRNTMGCGFAEPVAVRRLAEQRPIVLRAGLLRPVAETGAQWSDGSQASVSAVVLL